MKVGFVGMGTMGTPMAAHLARGGTDVLVWNRTPGRDSVAVEAGASSVPQLADLRICEVVILCVGGSEDVRSVIDDLSPKPGTLVIDHSTISPAAALEIARDLNSKGVDFVDAPVTGGSMGAQNGTLTIFMGGSHSCVEKALDVTKPYAKRAERVGDSGSGQMMKAANQIAVVGALLGLCESLAFADASGLDVQQAWDLIGGGAGGSWAFANYGPKLLNSDWTPGFSIKNQLKDLRYCLEEGRRLGIQLPTTAIAAELLGKMEQDGRGEQTTAALFEALKP